MVPPAIRRLLDELPASSLVLDVGGWADPDPRTDWVIDVGPYETRHWYATRETPQHERRERFTRDTWVQRDICDAQPWPFEDNQFDFVLCTQTLEDVRDPVRVCSEIARVGKAGYIETPSAATELTRGIESPLWCGWKHHRWLVREDRGRLVFLAKPHHIHTPFWPSISSPKRLLERAALPLQFTWHVSFEAREEILVDQRDLDRVLAAIVAESSRADPAGAARRAVAERAWTGYRRLRSGVGRFVRAGMP